MQLDGDVTELGKIVWMGVEEFRQVLRGDVQVGEEVVGVPGAEPSDDCGMVVGDGGDEGALACEAAVGLEVDS